jgi:hypothetical protein
VVLAAVVVIQTMQVVLALLVKEMLVQIKLTQITQVVVAVEVLEPQEQAM